MFFSAGHWLLTGTDPDTLAIERLAALGVAIKDHHDSHTQTNKEYETLLNSGMRIELPPLPMHPGEGSSFTQGVRVACRALLTRHPALTPLVVPLRVTVLVVPPKRPAPNTSPPRTRRTWTTS